MQGSKRNAAGKETTPVFRGKKKEQYERLVELREQLVDELRTLSDHSLTYNKQAGEELADIGSDQFLREMELGLVTEEGRKVRLIDEAIERLKGGTYGLCSECGKEISEARLEALPYAKLCIKCKSRRESAERA
jgi:DnaK suppressor protein